ncbi:MAG: hypothetical protein QM500_19920 [Methylococcales bacterium]
MNKLKIKTYPYIIAILCSAILIITLYMIFFNNIDVIGGIMGVSIPIVFLSILNKYTVQFDKDNNRVSIKRHNIFSKNIVTIPITDIKDFKIIRGRGKYIHSGYVCLITNHETLAITSSGAIKQLNLQKIINSIKEYLRPS